MSKRAYYSAELSEFLITAPETIVGELAKHHSQDLVYQQTGAWLKQIDILQTQLKGFDCAHVFFEFLIPRMGKRADVVLLVEGIIFVFEFKVGESQYRAADLRQAQGYALDLSCFHETSHDRLIVPILVATNAFTEMLVIEEKSSHVTDSVKANSENIATIIRKFIQAYPFERIAPTAWINGQYKPTPTIIEAAQALYNKHDVKDIARSDASAINLSETVGRIEEIIHQSRISKRKVICFVTGVPGAGKTLVGLQIATKHNNPEDEEYAVYLSGNGPLVSVLREALARDKAKDPNHKISNTRRATSKTIQNIHNFRDDSLKNIDRAPVEKVVIFDEAQRAWDKKKASDFMQKKRNQGDFNQSEPEFLISVMDRHDDWCVIVALIGGGQEINSGEAGLNGWFSALQKSFSNWTVYYSEKLKQMEYAGSEVDLQLLENSKAHSEPSLHLSTSMRSFRADRLSHFVHYLIHNQHQQAKSEYESIADKYPIYVARDLTVAKAWIRSQVKGLNSSGLIASSGAKRLKAKGIFVGNTIAAEDWFLNDFDDVRSSHFLEDIATEFTVQGLELDWCLVGWDADYRHNGKEFEHWSFSGSKWKKVKQEENKRFLENTYRVLLTRARQGMIIYIPFGDELDKTRSPSYYDNTYLYLKECGLKELS